MIRLIPVLLLIIIAAGCATLQTESEKVADISALQTFAWFDESGKHGDDVRIRDERVRKTVYDTIEQVLVEKGYRKADAAQADFVVTWFGVIEQKIKQEDLNHLYSPYGYGTLLRDPALNYDSPREIAEYEEGTLIIDLLDPDEHRLLWRGSGVGRVVKDRPPETALKNLARSVTQILGPVPSR